jgi:hypothetical protein
MRKIQTRVLPHDWLQQVIDFDVGSSTLSRNTKVIARRLIDFIKEEEDDSLLNPLALALVLYISFEKEFFTGFYDSVPVELINEGMNETKGEKGFNFTRRLHSVFVEFLIYKRLNSNGYKLIKIARTRGSCDLEMEKNNSNYNFEIKFKESEDIFKSRLFDIIDGMSLLDEYSFLRGETYEIKMKSKNIDHNTQKEILIDIKEFLVNKKDIYAGKHINIFNAKKRRKATRDIIKVSNYLSSLHISQELTEESAISELIQKMLIDNNGHITKLIKKSKSVDNFNGCLVWDVPFHNDIDCENIQSAFKKLELDFNLYIFIGGIAKVDCDFLLENNSIRKLM